MGLCGLQLCKKSTGGRGAAVMIIVKKKGVGKWVCVFSFITLDSLPFAH